MRTENLNIKLVPIAELLDKNYKFVIPPYQRGYRWNEKQVEDLLEDIWDFAVNAVDGDFYCLQPIVLEKRIMKQESAESWTVIDGQQRLTTLLLLLKYLQSKDEKLNQQLYTIFYDTRPTLDFDNIQPKDSIDSYYIYKSQKCIESWFEKKGIERTIIEGVLFNVSEKDENIPQVKFIWYIAENNTNIESIKTFSNLNKGKIRLTNAELIKALFILSSQENQTEFAMEWNEIENALQDPKFWFFITNKTYDPATRIDLIFDFITGKPAKADDDFAYKKFQLLYDKKSDPCWDNLNIKSLDESWLTVKRIFQSFRHWYEDPNLYHYIGYLITVGVTLKEIYNKTHNLPKHQVRKCLEEMIRKNLNLKEERLADLTYNDLHLVNKVLLLQNIEFCSISDTYRFPFDKYKEGNWDIEHIASQTENSLRSTPDKIKWLEYLKVIKPTNNTMSLLKDEALVLLEKLKTTGKESKDEFKNIYEQIFKEMEQGSIPDEDKDSLGNLALLDAGTNRSYGNALFETKRRIIIEKDRKGHFIPPCTRNVFLKYYSSDDNNISQWENIWSEKDSDNYLVQIHKTISKFLS